MARLLTLSTDEPAEVVRDRVLATLSRLPFGPQFHPLPSGSFLILFRPTSIAASTHPEYSLRISRRTNGSTIALSRHLRWPLNWFYFGCVLILAIWAIGMSVGLMVMPQLRNDLLEIVGIGLGPGALGVSHYIYVKRLDSKEDSGVMDLITRNVSTPDHS
jgi:hypothetical protein